MASLALEPARRISHTPVGREIVREAIAVRALVREATAAREGLRTAVEQVGVAVDPMVHGAPHSDEEKLEALNARSAEELRALNRKQKRENIAEHKQVASMTATLDDDSNVDPHVMMHINAIRWSVVEGMNTKEVHLRRLHCRKASRVRTSLFHHASVTDGPFLCAQHFERSIVRFCSLQDDDDEP
eukprot:5027461-Prymnesium_polylepis.1